MKYKFKREDTGEVIEVSWAVMMEQVCGFITLPDGTQARRCYYLEGYSAPSKERVKKPRTKKIVSDAVGFPQNQLDAFETDRVANGFSGVEFRRDPLTPEFYQAHFSSRQEFDKYIRHRGMSNHSSIGGVRLSQRDLDAAAALVGRKSEK